MSENSIMTCKRHFTSRARIGCEIGVEVVLKLARLFRSKNTFQATISPSAKKSVQDTGIIDYKKEQRVGKKSFYFNKAKGVRRSNKS